MRQAAPSLRLLGLTACLAVAALAIAPTALAQEEPRPLPTLTSAPDDALTEALESGELSEAEYALERAASVFELPEVRAEFGDVERAGRHDATLYLRDLALRLDDLAGADRRQAKHILARPPGGVDQVPIGNGWTNPESIFSPTCSAVPGVELCVHWVDFPGDPDAPDPADDDFDGIPDYVELALATLENVWTQEIGALGYRPPLSDITSSDSGMDARFDVYLDDVGSDLVFGYCTTDDPNRDSAEIFAVSAYCVLDNDYGPSQFGTAHTPQEFLEVTAAHEFHHASQFAYDWQEDVWLLEGTATNIEETVYPLIDDNVFFLDYFSPLTRPAFSLDRGGFVDSEYGAWIFWRYLQEKVAGGDPAILREIWERADSRDPDPNTPGDEPADDYSLLAVRKELTERGLLFADVFARFGVANRLLDYADASTAGYPTTPTSRTWGLGPNPRRARTQSWKINHLATRYFRFVPGARASRSGTLRLWITLPLTSARASLVIVRTDGSRTVRYLKQSVTGRSNPRVAFGRGAIKRVDLVLSNGSTRLQCWTSFGPPFYSCFGRPLDDARVFTFRPRVSS
jgi:hypothetical protein